MTTPLVDIELLLAERYSSSNMDPCSLPALTWGNHYNVVHIWQEESVIWIDTTDTRRQQCVYQMMYAWNWMCRADASSSHLIQDDFPQIQYQISVCLIYVCLSTASPQVLYAKIDRCMGATFQHVWFYSGRKRLGLVPPQQIQYLKSKVRIFKKKLSSQFSAKLDLSNTGSRKTFFTSASGKLGLVPCAWLGL